MIYFLIFLLINSVFGLSLVDHWPLMVITVLGISAFLTDAFIISSLISKRLKE